jgi:hypothetical protein
VQEVLLEACRVKMYPTNIIPQSSSVPHEPIPFYYNQARQSIPLVPYNRMQYQVRKNVSFIIAVQCGHWSKFFFAAEYEFNLRDEKVSLVFFFKLCVSNIYALHYSCSIKLPGQCSKTFIINRRFRVFEDNSSLFFLSTIN